MALDLNKSAQTDNNNNKTAQNKAVNDQTTANQQNDSQDENDDQEEYDCLDCQEAREKGEKRETIYDALGIPKERSSAMIKTIIDTIEKMDADGKDINRATVIQECSQSLPADMTREETLYMGFVIQNKAEAFLEYKMMKKGIDGIEGLLGSLFGK
jgi:formate dehydrogenase maturation protein FdhE